MPSHRLSPARSLQKLRTAFSQSPTRSRQAEPGSLSPMSTSTSTCSTSSTTTSPTTTQQPFGTTVAGFSFDSAPSPLFHMAEEFSSPRADSRRVIRRKKSCVEIEQEQERVQFDVALVGLVEPRPRFGPALGGIEEVLCGKI